MQIKFKKAEISDAELLIGIYNVSFHSDFIKYDECPAYGKTIEQMQVSIIEFPKFLITCNDKTVGCIFCKTEMDGNVTVARLVLER